MSAARPLTSGDLPEIPIWTLSDRLRKAREHADLGQKELGEKMGISHQAISKWESGRSNPSTSRLTEFAKIVNVDIRWLLGFEVPEGVDSTGHIFRETNAYRVTATGQILTLVAA